MLGARRAAEHSDEEHKVWSQTVWVYIPWQLLIIKFISLPEPPFPHLYNRDTNSICLPHRVWENLRR